MLVTPFAASKGRRPHYASRRDRRPPGEPRQGLVAHQISIRLDPRDPLLPWHLNRMAIAHYFLREYEAAIDTARRVIRLYPDFPLICRWLADWRRP
jgi:hypothetical protein